jgi:hypothetical protein
MAYSQPLMKTVLEPDRLNRKVLFALEVFDPVAQTLLHGGVSVKAKGLDGNPIVSASGRFVWLVEGDKWPEEITVVPIGLPFSSETVSPARPADLDRVTPAERLVRVVLRPGAAYDFDTGVTAVRGRLRETADPASPAVTDVRLQLAWYETTQDVWVPAPPPSTRDAATDPKGEFAVYFRRWPSLGQMADIDNGRILVRVQVSRSGVLRATPKDYPFFADPASGGRVDEGRLLRRDIALAWTDLSPI